MDDADEVDFAGYDCAICLDRIMKIFGCSTKCGHVFHEMCLETWFLEKRECPVCNMEQ